MIVKKITSDSQSAWALFRFSVIGPAQTLRKRLENRSDMLLSTLNKYVSGLGGRLTIKAEFPNRPSVTINGFSDLHA